MNTCVTEETQQDITSFVFEPPVSRKPVARPFVRLCVASEDALRDLRVKDFNLDVKNYKCMTIDFLTTSIEIGCAK